MSAKKAGPASGKIKGVGGNRLWSATAYYLVPVNHAGVMLETKNGTERCRLALSPEQAEELAEALMIVAKRARKC